MEFKQEFSSLCYLIKSKKADPNNLNLTTYM